MNIFQIIKIIVDDFFNFRYNCEDPNCYFDLARLKGVKYITWRDDKKLTSVKDVSSKMCHLC